MTEHPRVVSDQYLLVAFRRELMQLKQDESVAERMFKLFSEKRQRRMLDEVKVWHPNGQLAKHSYYHNGRHHGSHRTWTLDGKLVLDYHYHDGKYHGVCTEWSFDTGEIVAKHSYTHGEIVA
jgi:antitoxin component YwqK of YwqJK toxin-antitoxin module